MAFDVKQFLDSQNTKTANSTGGFNVDSFLAKAGVVKNPTLNDSTSMYKFAESQGLNPPQPTTPVNALKRVAGVLNVGTAFTSGAAKGILTGKNPVTEALSSAKKSATGEELKGFSDVYREKFGAPTSRWGKLGVGVGGFIADVLFDPLTYLTFGTSAGYKLATKTGEEVLSHAGTKLFQDVSTSAVKHFGEEEGLKKVSQLFEKAVANKGLDEAAVKDFVSQGWKEDVVRQVGKQAEKGLVDQGGIKMFGKSIVTGDQIAKSPIGKIGKAISDTAAFQGIKESLGKTFVANFGKNPKLVSLIEKAGIDSKAAIDSIVNANKQLFKGLNDAQLTDLFSKVWEKKIAISEAGKKAEDFARTLSKEELAKRGITTAFKNEKLTQKARTVLEAELRQGAKATQRGEKLVFADPKVQAVADKLFEGSTKMENGKLVNIPSIISELAKAAGLPEKDAIKFYIPSKFEEFMKARQTFATQHGITSPDLGFLKKFTGVSRADQITNPFELYTRGQVEVAVARIKSDTIKAVIEHLGVPLKDMTKKEAERLGYEKFSKKILGGKVEGWLPKSMMEDISKFYEPKSNTINDLAQATGFDFATRLFKGYVTSLFPGFHIRNITSNVFQNMLKIGVDALNPFLHKDALSMVMNKNLDKIITTKTGQTFTLGELKSAIEKESSLLEQGAFGSLEQQIKEGAAGLTGGINKQRFNPFSQEFAPIVAGRKVGQMAEQEAKLVAVLSAVMEGKSLKEGIKQAEDALFNYSKLTPFEKDVMRRIIPFYTFARKNAELQIKALATTPGRVAGQLKAIKGVGEAIGEPTTEEDKKGLPDYVLESLGIKGSGAFKNKYGQDTFFTGLGLPIEQFLGQFSGDKGIVSNAISSILTQANPLIKYPAERATGIDFFRDRPITEIYDASSLKSIFDAMPGPVAKEMKKLVEWQEIPNQPLYVNGKVVGYTTKYRANPFVLHFMRNLFTSRIQSTIGFLSAEEENNYSKLLRLFTGVKGWSIDQEQQKFYKEVKYSRELQDYLIRMGLARKFERMFVPKVNPLQKYGITSTK